MARKNHDTTVDPLHGGALRVPRTRGALSGILLLALGAWGALIPLIGPAFSYGLSPKKSWQWTAARWWLEILPGVVVVLGALLLLLAANRITKSLGALLGIAGGAWFVIGRQLATLFHIGSPGTPFNAHESVRTLVNLTFFEGLGAIILIVATTAFGRLSVRSVRDVKAAQKREIQDEIERRRQQDYEEQRARQVAASRPQHDEKQDEPQRVEHTTVVHEQAPAPAPTIVQQQPAQPVEVAEPVQTERVSRQEVPSQQPMQQDGRSSDGPGATAADQFRR